MANLTDAEIQDLLFNNCIDAEESNSEGDSDMESKDNSSEDGASSNCDGGNATVKYDDSPYAWLDQEVSNRAKLNFTGTPGRKVPVQDLQDCLQYFHLFLTPEIIGTIVEE